MSNNDRRFFWAVISFFLLWQEAVGTEQHSWRLVMLQTFRESFKIFPRQQVVYFDGGLRGRGGGYIRSLSSGELLCFFNTKGKIKDIALDNPGLLSVAIIMLDDQMEEIRYFSPGEVNYSNDPRMRKSDAVKVGYTPSHDFFKVVKATDDKTGNPVYCLYLQGDRIKREKIGIADIVNIDLSPQQDMICVSNKKRCLIYRTDTLSLLEDIPLPELELPISHEMFLKRYHAVPRLLVKYPWLSQTRTRFLPQNWISLAGLLHDEPIFNAWSSDDNNAHVVLRNLISGQIVIAFNEAFDVCRISPDGNLMAFFKRDANILKFWSTKQKKIADTLIIPDYAIDNIGFLDNNTLYVISSDGTDDGGACTFLLYKNFDTPIKRHEPSYGGEKYRRLQQKTVAK